MMHSLGSIKVCSSWEKAFSSHPIGFYVKLYPVDEAIFNFHMKNENFVRDPPMIIRAVLDSHKFAVSVKKKTLIFP